MTGTYILKSILAAIAAGICFLFGCLDIPFQTLLFFLVGDWLIGTYAAFLNREVSSRKAWCGMGKKIMTLFVIAMAYRIDIMLNAGGYVRLLAIYGFLGSETYSIIENLGKAGLVIPQKLLNYFQDFAVKMQPIETTKDTNAEG